MFISQHILSKEENQIAEPKETFSAFGDASGTSDEEGSLEEDERVETFFTGVIVFVRETSGRR